MLSSSKESK